MISEQMVHFITGLKTNQISYRTGDSQAFSICLTILVIWHFISPCKPSPTPSLCYASSEDWLSAVWKSKWINDQIKGRHEII